MQQALASGFIPDAPAASHTPDNRPLAEDSLPLPLKKRNWGTRHDKTNIWWSAQGQTTTYAKLQTTGTRPVVASVCQDMG